jgi:hypothetical protein
VESRQAESQLVRVWVLAAVGLEVPPRVQAPVLVRALALAPRARRRSEVAEVAEVVSWEGALVAIVLDHSAGALALLEI